MVQFGIGRVLSGKFPQRNYFGAGETGTEPYRVLARKHRPETFADVIGQEAMVRTLRNAFESDRIAHAFVLTGVRGVGKTTTARIVAKALNCVGPDGNGGPTIELCGVCDACVAIAEGRHVDVLEMDAASRTGAALAGAGLAARPGMPRLQAGHDSAGPLPPHDGGRP